jgi:tetratricopeptide (TPR) repeat protein
MRAIVLGALFAMPSLGHAATASELFADGNRLFRDDLYWAALLRYRQASEAGMDTPLLHYNLGIAHYKANQHTRARESLRHASNYGPLAPLAHYNLGLNAYALGNLDEALDWFRRARDQQLRTDISELATRAIRQLRANIETTTPPTVRAIVAERERTLTNLEFRVRTGGGIDSNVFRSPADAYVDLANPNLPTVTPEVQSGFYVPLSLSAKYQVNSLENEGFFGSYRFGGRFYQDESLQNADEYLHEIAFGSEYHNRDEDRETRVYSAFKVAQHKETWFDPDDGNQRDLNGVDISDRMSYLRYGPEIWLRRKWGRLTLGARAKGQLWNYENTEVVPEYDNEHWVLNMNGQYRFTRSSLLRLTAEYYTRRYGDRTAFELDGTQPLGNPSIRYDYTEFGLEARQRITSAMWFALSYARTEREDRHVGYNDYVRDDFGASFHLRLGNRFDLEASARYNIYNYENAFAFHEAAAGRKTLETAYGRATATFRMTQSFDLVGEYILRDVTSNDSRIEYSRNQAVLAIRWQM